MNEAVLMQAALFQLRAAIDSIEDEFLKNQLRLAAGLLGTSIEAATGGIDASVAADIEFALNDVANAASELAGDDAARVDGPLRMLQADVATLRNMTQLPAELVSAIRLLQGKLRDRGKAIERQTYVESGAAALPHDPQELLMDAQPIRASLAAAGFATPALDVFAADPTSLRFHSIRDIVDELDVIAGPA